VFGEIRRPEFIPVLLKVVEQEKNDALIAAALTALQSFDDLRIGDGVVSSFSRLSTDSRMVAETLLSSRTAWAMALLNAVESGTLKSDDVSEAGLRKMTRHSDAKINELIAKHWGSIAGASTEQMQQRLAELTALLSEGTGNPKKGKPLYMTNCGKCHQLFGEGGQIGPDLTPFKRDNQERILVNVVNPGLEVREGFENHIVVTSDGRVVNGFLADKDNQVVVLRGVDGQNIILRQGEIDEMVVSKISIMPEGTLKALTAEQIRDLFAYLRSSQPVNY
jgi:putative heme-binding domain-containing protein